MKKYLILVFVFNTLILNAQFRYTIMSSPDSIPILMNGEEKCITPCAINFYWKDKVNGQIVFSSNHPDYKTWSDTIYKKPSQFDFKERLTLERKVPYFELEENSPLVEFDKLTANFKDGTVIGKIINKEGIVSNIEWSGNTKIGEKAFENSFYEMVDKAGIKTTFSKSAELFSKQEKKRLPRYLIGTRLIEYKINKKYVNAQDYRAGKYKAKTELKLEWQVLDKANDEVVLKYENTGAYSFRETYAYQASNNLLAFEASFIDFIENSDFIEILKGSESVEVKLETNSSDKESIEIKKGATQKFESFGKMIKGVSSACATVVTDGGHGSGFFISKEGYFLTSYHVVSGVNKISVKLKSELELSAEIVAFDKAVDVALLQVTGSGFSALSTANSAVELGDDLITIGTPADIDLGQSIAKGMLSGNRKIENIKYLQLDLAISPGNSGGPLMNHNGEVVGLIQSKLVGEAIEGIGFALPIEEALKAVGVLLKD